MHQSLITCATLLATLTILTACGGGSRWRDYSYEKPPRTAEDKSGMATVSGRVLAPGDGAPAKNVELNLMDPATGRSRRQATDSDGQFVFRNVEPRTYHLQQEKFTPRYGPDQLQIKAKPDTTTRVSRWENAVVRDSISGRMVDENGRPLAGVKVTTNPGVYGSNMYPMTGADGRWRHLIAGGRNRTARLDIEMPLQRISFALPGYEAAPLVDPEPTTTAPLDIVMTPRPSADVEVVDTAGNPVREIAFAALVQEGKGWGLATLDGDATTSISDNGRHHLANLTRREFGLVVRELHGERDSRRSAFVIVPEGTDREPIRAVLQAPITISGRVLRADGSPAAGAMVRLRDVTGWASRRTTDSEPDGAYKIVGVTRGPYRLWADYGGESSRSPMQSTVYDGDTVVDLEVPAAVGLRGRLIGLDGKRLAGATVTVRHPAGWGRENPALTPKTVTTASDGTFQVNGLEPSSLAFIGGTVFDITIQTPDWEHSLRRSIKPAEIDKEVVIDLSGREIVTVRPQFDPSIVCPSVSFTFSDGEAEYLRRLKGESKILLPKGRIQPCFLWEMDLRGVAMLPAFEVKEGQENVFAPVIARRPVAFTFDGSALPAGKFTVCGANEADFNARYPDGERNARFWNRLRATTDFTAGQTSVERQLVPARYTAIFEGADGARWRSAEFTVPVEGGVVSMVREVN